MIEFELQWSVKGQAYLWTPSYFMRASREEINEAVGKGGCGPGEWGDKVVPDTIWRLNVRPA